MEYGQLRFQIKVSEFESKLESESGYIRQLAFFPNIHYSKNGNWNSNLKINVTWKFRMLSMVYGKKIRNDAMMV